VFAFALTAQQCAEPAALSKIAADTSMVERRQNLSREEFFTRYHGGNRPVILTGAMRDWPAMTRWTPDYLKRVCGGEMVQVMTGRSGDADYELHPERHRTAMPFAEYVDRVIAAAHTNDLYLVAQNDFMRTPGGKRLLEDVGPLPDYLDDRRDGFAFMWFGPGGTVTPLHHDTCDIFLAQVMGRKRIIMHPANQKPLVYNHIGVHSAVDAERPDLISHPLYRYAARDVFTLEPGEVLFIPVGWWHHVRALDLSLSMSFTNFWGSFGGNAYQSAGEKLPEPVA
jgi:ribosomal protein L16 Arg81 hydroxylase